MSALRRFLIPLAAALSLAAWSPGAEADVIRLSYEDTQDPAETFDDDCLGDTPAEDCDVRAALIEGELVTLLSQLESDEDPATLALFQAALELESPLVQAMAVQYLSRAEQQPDDFFSKVKAFFLGPDAPLGAASSAVLQTSSDEGEQRLAELFDEQRPASAYESPPAVDDDDLSDDHLLAACVNDVRLDRMESFAEAERFEPAGRLLMYDRFVRAFLDPAGDYPVTAFSTDASFDDVSAFFTERFGEPWGPVAGTQQRLADLSLQLVTLQAAAAGGDQAAIKKLQDLAGELEKTQRLASLDTYLQLTAMHAENDLVWLDGDIDDAATQLMRAVTAGEDSLLGQTVIRYINAPTGQLDGSAGNGTGEGDGEGQAGASAGPGDEPSAGGASSEEGRPVSRSDDGCGCAVPGPPSRGASLAALSVLAWALRRARRRKAALD
jgi:MYXO-CTERM domain-containing protein